MTPAIASAHTAHNGTESISSGANVIMAMRTIDRDRPITIALLRASIPAGVTIDSVDIGVFGASAVFIHQVSAAKARTREWFSRPRK